MCTRPERHSADTGSWETDQRVYTQAKRLNNFEKYDTVHFLIKPSKSDNNFKRLINLTAPTSQYYAHQAFPPVSNLFGQIWGLVCKNR